MSQTRPFNDFLLPIIICFLLGESTYFILFFLIYFIQNTILFLIKLTKNSYFQSNIWLFFAEHFVLRNLQVHISREGKAKFDVEVVMDLMSSLNNYYSHPCAIYWGHQCSLMHHPSQQYSGLQYVVALMSLKLLVRIGIW